MGARHPAELGELLLAMFEGRQCGLEGFRAADIAFGPSLLNGSVARSREEAEALDASMPAEVMELIGSTLERMEAADSVRHAAVVFRNGWKVSAITGRPSAGGMLAVGGNADVPTYEVAVRNPALDEMREPQTHVTAEELDDILREVEAAPDVRDAGSGAVQ